MRWQPDDLIRRLDDVVAVYGAAMGYPAELLADPARVRGRAHPRPGSGRSPRSTTTGPCSASDTGTASEPASGGTTRSGPACGGKERERWLRDCFEVVETARAARRARATASARGNCGLLPGMASARPSLLSTPEADEETSRAWRLYRRFGFVDVLRDFHVPRRRPAVRGPRPGLPLTGVDATA